MKSISTEDQKLDFGNQKDRYYVQKSWFGFVLAVCAWVATEYLALPVMNALGNDLVEGELVLMARNFTGVAVFVLMIVLVLAPLSYGLRWAWRAMQTERKLGTVAVFAINLLGVLVLVYMAIDQVLMTYWPGLRGE